MFVKNITETTQKIRIDWVETEIGAWEVFQTTESKAEELVRNYPSIIGYADAGGISWSGEISDLDDVSITNPTDWQILSFDETSEKWENKDIQRNLINIESESLYKNASLRMLGDDVIPLIIIAWQSNADWRAPYTSLPNRDETKRLSDNNYDVDDYMMWNDTNKTFATYNVRTNNWAWTDNWDDWAGVDKYSFDPFFARYFINTYNRPLYALRVTLWGIPIWTTTSRAWANNTWNAKIWYFETQWQTNVRYLCKVIADRIKDIKERAETNNKTILPIAILWHQWEWDWTTARIPYYKQNLKNVISFIRGIVWDPKLPFINAFINKNYKEEYTQINNIYLELNKEDQFMKTVDMEGHYTSIWDNLHFDWQAFAYMGQQMFEYYKLYDYTPNEREPGVDITSVFWTSSTAGKTWSGSWLAIIRTLAEFENLTPADNAGRSCAPNAIAWSDYKNNYRKIRITPLNPSIKVYFATNGGVDDTIFKINWSNWITQTMTFDCTSAHDLIISIQFDTGSSNTISDIVKVEVIP